MLSKYGNSDEKVLKLEFCCDTDKNLKPVIEVLLNKLHEKPECLNKVVLTQMRLIKLTQIKLPE